MRITAGAASAGARWARLCAAAALLWLALLASPASLRVERIVLEVDEITSPATQAAGTSVTLDLARGEPVAHVRVGQVERARSRSGRCATSQLECTKRLRARTDDRLPRRHAHRRWRADKEHHAEGFGRVRHGASAVIARGFGAAAGGRPGAVLRLVRRKGLVCRGPGGNASTSRRCARSCLPWFKAPESLQFTGTRAGHRAGLRSRRRLADGGGRHHVRLQPAERSGAP